MRATIRSLIPLLLLIAPAAAQDSLPEALMSQDPPQRRAVLDKLMGRQPKEADPAFEGDRDSFTPSAKSVGQRGFAAEASYSFIDNRSEAERHSFPELLLRYGLTQRIELRGGWNASLGGPGDVSGTTSVSGFDAAGATREYRLTYGLKFAITQQQTFIPETAIIVMGVSPTGGDFTLSQVVGTFVGGWQLPNKWQIDGALRYATSADLSDHFGVWAPSAVLKVPVLDNLSVQAEYFGVFTRGKAPEKSANYVGPGALYSLTPNFVIGARAGFGVNDHASRFFVNTGIDWRY
jgi:Putative MetA-pathway of phenol degradation